LFRIGLPETERKIGPGVLERFVRMGGRFRDACARGNSTGRPPPRAEGRAQKGTRDAAQWKASPTRRPAVVKIDRPLGCDTPRPPGVAPIAPDDTVRLLNAAIRTASAHAPSGDICIMARPNVIEELKFRAGSPRVAIPRRGPTCGFRERGLKTRSALICVASPRVALKTPALPLTCLRLYSRVA